MNITTNTQFCLLFPGQGSQAVGMGKELANQFQIAKDIFNQADQIVGFPLSNIAWDGPAELLNDTVNTQPALFVHSMASLRVWESLFPKLKPEYVCGHSLGELTAVVAVGAMSFEDGLKLVRIRGELMKEAGEIASGSMAAILGLDIPAVEEICKQASAEDQSAQVANDNCPGQVVISGSKEGIEKAIVLAKEAGAKRALPLAVSIAAHSVLMDPAQKRFNQAVEETTIGNPKIPILGNVSAQPLTSAEEIRADLTAQLNSRVRWTESIQYMASNNVDTFIELGSGNVLSGLVRRIDKTLIRHSFGTADDFISLKD